MEGKCVEFIFLDNNTLFPRSPHKSRMRRSHLSCCRYATMRLAWNPASPTLSKMSGFDSSLKGFLSV